MKLIEFSYKDAHWQLQNLEFGSASLIVGKNATGKSRTLKQLNNFFRVIQQAFLALPVGEFKATFSNEHSTYKYNIGITEGSSISEELYQDDNLVLTRKPAGEVRLWNVLSNSLDQVNPPSNKLVIHVNRDTRKYPFLEDIAVWAEQSFSFKFGGITPDYHDVYMESNRQLEDVVYLYNSLNDNVHNEILQELASIGYQVEHIEARTGAYEQHFLMREKGLWNNIFEHEVSQGMLRSLYLLTFIAYLTSLAKASTVLIDDLCEGLDYERATKLGKLVFDKCRQSNIQLIATSNDMFLMDVVDIRFWNVLQRENSLVTAINTKNHPQLFENFKYTGLSNFDFFSSDYIPQKIDQ